MIKRLQTIKVLGINSHIYHTFSNHTWAIPLRVSQKITQECSNILATSKRSPLKIESDRGAVFYDTIFQNFWKSKNIRHFSRFTDKDSSSVERVIRIIRNLLKKQIV